MIPTEATLWSVQDVIDRLIGRMNGDRENGSLLTKCFAKAVDYPRQRLLLSAVTCPLSILLCRVL